MLVVPNSRCDFGPDGPTGLAKHTVGTLRRSTNSAQAWTATATWVNVIVATSPPPRKHTGSTDPVTWKRVLLRHEPAIGS